MGKRTAIGMIALLTLYAVPSAAFAQPAASDDYLRADRLFAAARYQEALPLYHKALKAPPASVPVSDIYTRIGDSYFQLGGFRDALGAYRKALDLQKPAEQPQTRYWIGFCSFLLGRDAEAVAEFLKIPELHPDAGMWVSTAYYWAGRASERMGKKDQAAGLYRKAGGSGKSTQGRFAIKRAEEVKKTKGGKVRGWEGEKAAPQEK